MKTKSPSKDPSFASYLEDLQEEAVQIIAITIGVLGYVWIFYNFWAVYINRYLEIPVTGWIGGWVLAVGAVISYFIGSQRSQINAYFLSACILTATVCGVLALASPSLLYLLVIPVIFSGVLIGHQGLAVVATIVIVLAFQLAPRLATDNTWLPVGAIILVTFATWLSERNLRTALTWTWSGYERARKNQEVARERAGELQRTLKALDEATYRLERANYMLALARDQAEEARQLKQQFAQTISHELRTPLNLIVGFTELMAETPDYYGVDLTPTYLRDLSTVHRNARHLQDLVNDVLDLARIEAAQMSMVPVETELEPLVQEVITTIRGLVEARGLYLRADLEADLPNLWVDPVRIRQVILNLISNAIRFTSKGGITISARQRSQEVVFAISDTGEGIDPKDQKRIFEVFHQADGSTTRQHEGAGLGLAISKQFIELHGGRIWVRSEIGEGSTFYFSLPIRPKAWEDTLDTQLDHALAQQSPPPVNGEDPILILVTRSPSAAGLITRYVHGCRVVTMATIEEAERAAKQFMPQVVVIDRGGQDHAHQNRIPEIQTPEDLAALAEAWELPNTSFITVKLPGEESLLQHLTIQGYLIKPVSRDNLWNTMRHFGKDIDRVLIVDDDRDFVRLLSRLLQDNMLRSYQVSHAYNGQQALASIELDRPDIILLDLGLPDITGHEVIKQIRSQPEWENLPIVVVSAQENVDYQERLPGVVLTTRANGLLPGEIVRWIQAVVEAAVSSSTLES